MYRGLACDVMPWQCHGDALQNGGQNTLGLWRVALQDGRRYHGEKMRAQGLYYYSGMVFMLYRCSCGYKH